MSLVVVVCGMCVIFFKQKTAYELRISDWSSDVCSSDLAHGGPARAAAGAPRGARFRRRRAQDPAARGGCRTRRPCPSRPPRRAGPLGQRSEERRGGKESGRTWRSRGGPDNEKKKKSYDLTSKTL